MADKQPHPVFGVPALAGDVRLAGKREFYVDRNRYRQVLRSHLELHARYADLVDQLNDVGMANAALQTYVGEFGTDLPNEVLRLIAGVDHALMASAPAEYRPDRLCGCGDVLDGTSEGTHCGNCHAGEVVGLELERDRLSEERKQLVERGLSFARKMNEVIASCEQLRVSHEELRNLLENRTTCVRLLGEAVVSAEETAETLQRRVRQLESEIEEMERGEDR